MGPPLTRRIPEARVRTEMGYASDQGGGACWRGPLQEANATMSFCEHCAGQRFDRAQVLRVTAGRAA